MGVRETAEEISQDKVDALRAAFFEALESQDDIAHSADIERAKTNDFWLKRFLAHHDLNQKLALEMMIDTVKWRKSSGANDITESNVKMDYIVEGSVYARGRDKDGHLVFIFHCKKHVKGVRDLDELKRCVVYWLDRLEREENGHALTVFFDLENCGLSNMDLDFTRYLIGLFKNYYPWFLNYIIVYEMAWILNAAFKLIKSWLPPKAVERIKAIKKAEVGDWIPLDQALVKWGGTDDYTFSFIPESTEDTINNNAVNNKKVHFADASPMSESPGPAGDKDNEAEPTNKMLSITPSNVITFTKDGNEQVSLLELENTDSSTIISYKMKTTSPEKFRVRPSVGCLAPGAKDKVSVTLLPGFQLRSLSRDKFLLMTMAVESADISPQALSDLWKNVSNKNVTQHRLRCAQPEETVRNGSAVMVGATQDSEDSMRLKKLTMNVSTLLDSNAKLQKSLERTQLFQMITIGLTIVIAFVLVYFVRSEMKDIGSSQSCFHQNP